MVRSTYLSIITFKCQLSKHSDKNTEWLNTKKKKNRSRTYNILLTRDSFYGKTHTQTDS